MSIFNYLCSCFPLETGKQIIKNGYETVMGYLNNNAENVRILQEQKFQDDYQYQCGTSVYKEHKQYVIVYGQEAQPQQTIYEDQGFIYDPNWTNHQILQAKGEYDLKCLKALFDADPTDDGFETILDQETNNIKIFHKQMLVEESKRINIYRYTFTLNIALKEYLEIFTTQKLNSLDTNLKIWKTIQNVSDDLIVCHAEYKKVLIIPPKDFVFLYYQHFDEELQTYYQIGSSVQSTLPMSQGTTRGLIILSGYSVKQVSQNKLVIEAYANIDLDLKINPSMVKQPTKNEIKKYIDKIIKQSQHQQETKSEVKNEQLLQ